MSGNQSYDESIFTIQEATTKQGILHLLFLLQIFWNPTSRIIMYWQILEATTIPVFFVIPNTIPRTKASDSFHYF